jgi:hypothetical protein
MSNSSVLDFLPILLQKRACSAELFITREVSEQQKRSANRLYIKGNACPWIRFTVLLALGWGSNQNKHSQSIAAMPTVDCTLARCYRVIVT